MCESDPPLQEPMCVQVCDVEALTYQEREEVREESAEREDLATGLESLADRYGLEKILETLARMAQRG
jgi:benzoyl-CoA reductase subunit BamC